MNAPLDTNPKDIIRKLRSVRSAGAPEDPRYAWLFKDASFTLPPTATSGLAWYDLEASVKFLVAVPTPLRKKLARVSGKGGIEADWAAITGMNTNNVRPGVSDGNRGGVIDIQTTRYNAVYKTLGLESSATFEAQLAAEGLDDLKAEATLRLLQSVMLQEEYTILGGNSSLALGTTPAPTVLDSGTGGSLINNTSYSVVVAALSFDAVNLGKVNATGVQGMTTRTNADGSVDTFGGGAAKVSTNTTHTTGNSPATATYVLNCSLSAPVTGAFGYAWYVSTTAGQEKLVAITTLPSVTITALPNAGNQAAAALGTTDGSTDALVFDGLLYQALKPGSNAYVQALNGTLTGDGAGGIVEWDTMLKSMYDNYRLGPNVIWLSTQQLLDASKKILAGGSTGAQRFVFQTVQDALTGGTIVRKYLNKFTGEVIDIEVHPNMPSGAMLATTDTLPYALSNVGNVMQIRTQQDYFQIQWPLFSRKWQFGCYTREVLQHYFPPSMGLIYNITPG